MKETERVEVGGGLTEVYVYDEETPEEKHLAYTIDPTRHEILFRPDENFAVSKVLLEGFDDLPPEFSEGGYIKGGLMYYLSKKFEEKGVSQFIISRSQNTRARKVKSGLKVVFSYADFSALKDQLTTISNEAKRERSLCVDEFFYRSFPSRYSKTTASSRNRAAKAIRNLTPDIVEHLSTGDVSTVLDFVETLLTTKYRSDVHKRKLFNAAKIKIDDLAITDVIELFEKMLQDDPSESKWGAFLKRNLFLIDSKYIHVLPELNVVLANYRKVDFGLVDVQGYLDIFEIKKPSTRLLSKTTDRGNHFWSTDAVKAIVQAEKYLFNAERKAASLAEDVDIQRKTKVEVIRPRAFVLLGDSGQLDDDNKRRDFRVLRMSLKNVEVIIYDELLERIKNQKGKVYVD
jgi:hypothetical protein